MKSKSFLTSEWEWVAGAIIGLIQFIINCLCTCLFGNIHSEIHVTLFTFQPGPNHQKAHSLPEKIEYSFSTAAAINYCQFSGLKECRFYYLALLEVRV